VIVDSDDQLLALALNEFGRIVVGDQLAVVILGQQIDRRELLAIGRDHHRVADAPDREDDRHDQQHVQRGVRARIRLEQLRPAGGVPLPVGDLKPLLDRERSPASGRNGGRHEREPADGNRDRDESNAPGREVQYEPNERDDGDTESEGEGDALEAVDPGPRGDGVVPAVRIGTPSRLALGRCVRLVGPFRRLAGLGKTAPR